jgi:hypothetical protein
VHARTELVAHPAAGTIIGAGADGVQRTPHRAQLPFQSGTPLAMHQMLRHRLADRLRVIRMVELPVHVGMEMVARRQALRRGGRGRRAVGTVTVAH